MARDSDLESEKGLLKGDDHTRLLTESIISQGATNGTKETQYFGIRTHPHKKFVWNLHLLNEGELMKPIICKFKFFCYHEFLFLQH